MPLPLLLAPLLSALAEKGLGLLAGAIEAKGKDLIEEKLGVKIPDDPAKLTPELTYKLQELQMHHEEFLTNAALEKQRLDLEEIKAHLADTADARAREKTLNESENASTLSKNLTSILALVVVIGGGLMLAFTSDADVKYAVVSLMSMVLSYFFGTSMGSTKAQQALRDVAAKVGPLK